VHARLEEAGLPVASVPVEPGRENLVASVPGSGERPRLVLLAHMDTVPIGDGWSIDPLGGTMRTGRIYGRGTADMKAGLAVALNLLASVAHREPPRGDIVLCATVDAEGPDMAGAHALVAADLFRPDDQVLAPEPTGLRLRVAHMGLRWFEVTIVGRTAHAGRAHLGIDANHAMARIVDRLKARVERLPTTTTYSGGRSLPAARSKAAWRRTSSRRHASPGSIFGSSPRFTAKTLRSSSTS
jgi:succinyl-diaminopimelate desuccinylase